MATSYLILAINPGSTSTKVALYRNDEEILNTTIRHSTEELNGYPDLPSQLPLREEAVRSVLRQAGEDVRGLSAVVGRGGLIRPVPGGTYLVEEAMLADLRAGTLGEHASNLGGILAWDIAETLEIPAYIVDPVVVDELQDIARPAGTPSIERTSIFHALNHKAVARRFAAEQGRSYEELNLIVVHLGGGITVGAHRRGRVIDVNDGLNGEGPFSPERAGGLPALKVVSLCFAAGADEKQIRRSIKGAGGLSGYLGTNDAQEVGRRIEAGDSEAELIYRSMAYQVSKEIGAMAVVLRGEIDALLFTGGLARDRRFVDWISEAVSFLAPIHVYPGEDEMRALAGGALRVLTGAEQAKRYPPEETE
ncbi:MAG: butyrate kinase [Spirochaetota bacterium]